MSTTQTMDPTDVICGLKAAVTALECHHNMQLLKKQQKQKKEKKPPPPPMYMMIPIEEETFYKDKYTKGKKLDRSLTKDTLYHAKEACGPAEIIPHKDKKDSLIRLNFPEMRGGILYTRCSCVHRDGLQEFCPLSQCQGQPNCLIKPWPLCPPGKFFGIRHPELYSVPQKPNTLVL